MSFPLNKDGSYPRKPKLEVVMRLTPGGEWNVDPIEITAQVKPSWVEVQTKEQLVGASAFEIHQAIIKEVCLTVQDALPDMLADLMIAAAKVEK